MSAERILVLDQYRGVKVGGRFNGWLMRLAADGQWVTVRKLPEEDPFANISDDLKELYGVESKTAFGNFDDAQTECVARAICRRAHPDYTPTQIDHAWTAYKDHALDAIAALHGRSGKPRKINTHYNPKPVPARGFDWSATFDDYEPGAPIGYGATEDAAIADLHREAAESQVGSRR